MFNSNASIARACRALNTQLIAPDPVTLTADTLPSVIFATHCELVRAAYATLQTLDIATLSDACDLPTWNITRALCALNLIRNRPAVPSRAATRARSDKRSERIRRWISTHPRYATVKEIAEGTGLPCASVQTCVEWPGGGYKRVHTGRNMKACQYAYQLSGFKAAAVAV